MYKLITLVTFKMLLALDTGITYLVIYSIEISAQEHLKKKKTTDGLTETLCLKHILSG